MKSPTLSIITINRNNSEGLRKTMESVLNQDCNDFEYIIIDGASTDGSIEVIKEFLNKPKYANKVSYWCSEPDKGLYNALNKGISKAKGSLIGLMHSGDWYLPSVFTDVIEAHKKNPTSIVYGALKAVKNGAFESIWGYNADALPKQMIPHLSTFVPLKIYKDFGNFDESYKIAADYEMFLRYYTQKVHFDFIDRIICCFNLEGISQNSNNVTIETNKIKRKYGYYIEPSKKQKLVSTIKKIIHW